jgi:hypothetical protein
VAAQRFTQSALATLAEQAIEAHGTAFQQARTWEALGDLAYDRSDHDRARREYEQALPLYRQAGSVLARPTASSAWAASPRNAPITTPPHSCRLKPPTRTVRWPLAGAMVRRGRPGGYVAARGRGR